MAEAEAKKEPVKLAPVTLKKRHRHGGKWHKPGDDIKVTPRQVGRLRAQGKI